MDKKYTLSFTAGGLLYSQSVVLAKIILDQPNLDWKKIKERILSQNSFNTTRASSQIRYFLEIKRRFQTAYPFELSWLANESDGSKLVLFVLCCKYYTFIGDFIAEVIAPKLKVGDTILTFADFFAFYENKSETHPELVTLKETSRKKLQSVLFRMLAESGIIDSETKRICKPHIPLELTDQYRKAGDYTALIHLLQY